jgi:hypothetical protein
LWFFVNGSTKKLQNLDVNLFLNVKFQLLEFIKDLNNVI